MIRLRYGNTNTFFIPGSGGGLLVDTDYAGTLRPFLRALKESGLRTEDIAYVMATHYHPDHCGLIGELNGMGARLLLIDVQAEHVRFPDYIFERDGIAYKPPDESKAMVVSCGESREFLKSIGIDGEIVSTPSHSADSVSLVLDDGSCFAGDLEPPEYIEAYPEEHGLRKDWERLLSLGAKRVFFSHRNEQAAPEHLG